MLLSILIHNTLALYYFILQNCSMEQFWNSSTNSSRTVPGTALRRVHTAQLQLFQESIIIIISLHKGVVIIESVDSISRDERDVPLTQYITNA